MKIDYLLFPGFAQSLPFPLPHPPFGIQNCLLPMGHQICKFTWVYLSTGFGRKASPQNVISKQEKRLKELEELKFKIQKCKFERDELYRILDLYIYDDWDYR